MIQQNAQLFVLLLLAVLLYFLPHVRVQKNNLIGQIEKYDEQPLDPFEFIGIFFIQLTLKPLHEIIDAYLDHYFKFKSYKLKIK